jgi:hypothetical protein
MYTKPILDEFGLVENMARSSRTSHRKHQEAA